MVESVWFQTPCRDPWLFALILRPARSYLKFSIVAFFHVIMEWNQQPLPSLKLYLRNYFVQFDLLKIKTASEWNVTMNESTSHLELLSKRIISNGMGSHNSMDMQHLCRLLQWNRLKQSTTLESTTWGLLRPVGDWLIVWIFWIKWGMIGKFQVIVMRKGSIPYYRLSVAFQSTRQQQFLFNSTDRQTHKDHDWMLLIVAVSSLMITRTL